MIIPTDYQLQFRFDGVHADAQMTIEPRRTLRVPDDGKVYPLPPSSRAFPLRHVDDHPVPEDWAVRGGMMLPVYRSEAMWIAFSGGGWVRGYPFAVKIGAGKINVVSGQPWDPRLDPSEGDYIVVPRQARLDGFCVAKRVVRQFVAMPAGRGYSVEEQLTGAAEHGGLQIVVYPMRKERYQRTLRRRYEQASWLLGALMLRADSDPSQEPPYFRRPRWTKMSLGAGARMKQSIYKDPYGIDAWDQSVSENRCFVTLADARQWQALTGHRPPTEPPTAKDYAATGLPWLDDYDEPDAVPGALPLTMARGVEEMAVANGEPLAPVGEVAPALIEKGKPPRD